MNIKDTYFKETEKEWLKSNYSKYSLRELTKEFNNVFTGFNRSYCAITTTCNKLGLFKTQVRADYTNEQKEFIIAKAEEYRNERNRNHIITKEFNERFGTNLSCEKIRSRMKILKVCSSSNSFKYSEEQKQWLKEHSSLSLGELTKQFNNVFEVNKSTATIAKTTKDYGLRTTRKTHRKALTEEQEKFLYDNISAYTIKQLTEEFNKIFNIDFTYKAIANKCKKLGLTHIDKQYKKQTNKKSKKLIFKKGIELDIDNFIKTNVNSYIKSNKIDYNAIICDVETMYGKTLKRNYISGLITRFNLRPDGISRANSKPIGYEFVKEGRWYIKIGNNKKSKYENSMLKCRYLYEKYHNCKLKDNDKIIHLDGDFNNFNENNLVMVSNNVLGKMNGHKYYKLENNKLKATAIKLCELEVLADEEY